jgi:uncharacterized protein YndB with AHSA1/START domain
MKISVETLIHSDIEHVWKTYTHPKDIIQWNAASPDWHTPKAEVDLRVGGMFTSRMEAKDGSMGFDFSGVYTKIIEHQLIEYEFGGRIAVVEFSTGSAGVKVAITFDAEDIHPIDMQREGWQAILNNFKSYAESTQI